MFEPHECATLGQIIAHLMGLPPDMVVEEGFRGPHSYRGFYECLAFRPCERIASPKPSPEHKLALAN